MNKLLVVCGQTATRKTELGISLAKKFNGEIISADSRQVYKGMDIITGKDLSVNSTLRLLSGQEFKTSSFVQACSPAVWASEGKQNSKLRINNRKLSVGFRLKNDIPIWLVDIVEPDYYFNAGEYATLARRVIEDIWSREKLPILLGGTGFYIKAVIDPSPSLNFPPDMVLRRRLENLTVVQLQKMLERIDDQRWQRMNDSDKNNPRRLIRAIELVKRFKNEIKNIPALKLINIDSILFIGLKAPFKYLRQLINRRIEKRIQAGVIAEIKNLIEKGYSWNSPSMTSSGARNLKEYIEGKEDLNSAVSSWKIKEHNLARQQMTWFNQEKRIKWFEITDSSYIKNIEEEVKIWYTA